MKTKRVVIVMNKLRLRTAVDPYKVVVTGSGASDALGGWLRAG